MSVTPSLRLLFTQMTNIFQNIFKRFNILSEFRDIYLDLLALHIYGSILQIDQEKLSNLIAEMFT